MGYGIRLKVWGERACFSRPEMRVERVSYDVMTPSAARGILECIHWKPAIRWAIDRIHVLNEPRFDSFRRNEVKGIMLGAETACRRNAPETLSKIPSQEREQRATLYLRDVAYVIEAHFEMVDHPDVVDKPEKHYNIFLRRAREGQAFRTPCLGCKEFAAHFTLLEDGAETPVSALKGERDLGWMLQDIDYTNGMQPVFFRPIMRDGVFDVPPLRVKKVGA
ncbi:MAG: type I-C CRISPR-associated protein Cas5c [Oscillospiraceae bacterium]|jgi:CRISPR-associated protein Cas5d|nr:type I-C CRISPR-associated protein Cas5c [Oscillospiraceae bacterium]